MPRVGGGKKALKRQTLTFWIKKNHIDQKYLNKHLNLFTNEWTQLLKISIILRQGIQIAASLSMFDPKT